MGCNCKEIKVLVADEPKTVAQLKAGFEGNGISVVTATTQKEAEAMIKPGAFNAAVVGLMLENADSGFVLSYRIKKMNPAIPVIMVTDVTRETGCQFNKAQDPHGWIKADAILQKEIRFEQLFAVMKKLLHCGE